VKQTKKRQNNETVYLKISLVTDLTLLVPALQQTVCVDNVTYLYRSWNKDTKTVKTKTRTANAIRKSVAWIFRLNFFNIKNKVSGEQRIDIFCNFASFYGII
jgi:hypothetical protein